MTAEVLRGNKVAKSLEPKINDIAEKLTASGIKPTLAIIRIGNKQDDLYYQQSAEKRCAALGIAVEIYAYDCGITLEELTNEIINLNLDEAIHGVLIMRPLPAHIDDSAVCCALDPLKDVDGITDSSLAGVIKNEDKGFAPCTAEACIELLDYYNINVKGSRAVVVGRSLVVGKPLALMLTSLDATVTVCHTKTKNLAEVTREADILVAAAGKIGLITKEHIKTGAAVIDVGVTPTGQGGFAGDADYESVIQTASAVTPVPGGVGTITSTILALHTLKAALRQAEKKEKK